MKRDNESKNYIVLGVVVAGVLLISMIVYFMSSSKGNVNDTIKDASTEIGKTVEEKKKETTEELTEQDEIENTVAENVKEEKDINEKSDVKEENKVTKDVIAEVEEKKSEEENKVEKKKATKETKKEIKFSKPVNGSVLKEFAKEKLVYSETLKEWVAHNGVDIKADKTAVVAAAADGKIYAIKNDPRYGLTVIINHDDGYQTVYSNLLTAEFVVEGEEVKAGQNIGTVGNSASFEVSDEYHLHFELLKDNEYLDPTIYVSFE